MIEAGAVRVVFEDELLAEATDAFRSFLVDERIEAVAVERERLGDVLGDVDVVVCYRLTPEQTAGADGLRLVQCFSAGADGIDREALPPGCVLCNVRGHEGAMAEWVLMAMLALHRRLLVLDRDLRRGRWHREGEDYLGEALSGDLAERTVGSVGFGPIGAAVAARDVDQEAVRAERLELARPDQPARLGPEREADDGEVSLLQKPRQLLQRPEPVEVVSRRALRRRRAGHAGRAHP